MVAVWTIIVIVIAVALGVGIGCSLPLVGETRGQQTRWQVIAGYASALVFSVLVFSALGLIIVWAYLQVH